MAAFAGKRDARGHIQHELVDVDQRGHVDFRFARNEHDLPRLCFLESFDELFEALDGVVAAGNDAAVAIVAADRADIVGFRPIYLSTDLYAGLP